jgi:hypothetical protein
VTKDAIEPINKHELRLIREQWQLALEDFQKLACDDSTEPSWSEWLAHVQVAINELEGDRTELTKPLNAQLKKVNDIFRETKAPLEAFKALAKAKLAELALERDNAARRLREAAALAAQAGDTAAVSEALGELVEAPTATAGVRTSYSWEPIVVDANLVPREYLVVDVDALREIGKINAQDDYVEPIPGIQWRRVVKTSPVGRRSK